MKLEIENFNKTKFNCNEDYVNKKNELRNKIDSFYEEKRHYNSMLEN